MADRGDIGSMRRHVPATGTSLLRAAGLLSALMLLGGCGAMVYGAAETVSVTQSKKTIVDNVASLVTGEDCNSLAYGRTGKYCRSAAEIAAAEAQAEAIRNRELNTYCYRRLGGITCHDQPDPTASAEILVTDPRVIGTAGHP